MATYSLATQCTVVTASAATTDWKAAAGSRPRLLEICLINAAATQSNYNLGVSANTTVAQSAPVNLLPEDPNDPTSQTTNAVAWTVAPTSPTVLYRLMCVQAAVGIGNIHTFPRGIVLPTTGASMVLWNRQANSANMNVYVVIDE